MFAGLWHEHKGDYEAAKQLLFDVDADGAAKAPEPPKLRALYSKRDLPERDGAREGDRVDLEKACSEHMRIDRAIKQFAVDRGLVDHCDGGSVDVRMIGLTGGSVSRGSITAQRVGHPFLDALLLAHRSDANMVLSPLMLWELISEAVVLAFRGQYAALRSFADYQHKASSAADGCFRMALSDMAFAPPESDQTAVGCSDAADASSAQLRESAWSEVRDELLDALRRMSKMLRYVDHGGVLFDSEGDAPNGRVPSAAAFKKMARLQSDDGTDVCIAPSVAVRVDGKLNQLPPINVLLERVPLPLPQDLVERSDFACCRAQDGGAALANDALSSSAGGSRRDDLIDGGDDATSCDANDEPTPALMAPLDLADETYYQFRSRVASYHFKGTLLEWSILFNGVADLAEYPEFSFWCTRVLWVLYHILRYGLVVFGGVLVLFSNASKVALTHCAGFITSSRRTLPIGRAFRQAACSACLTLRATWKR